MQGVVVTNWKKKMLFGAGLLALAIAVTSMGVYSTFRADATQSLKSVPILEEVDMRIDEKTKSVLAELDEVVTITESEDAISGSSQQSASNSTNQNVEVQVNGVPVAVPENGSVHKEIKTEDGSARIDVSLRSNTSSGDSRTRSSINVDFDSSTRVRSQTRE